MVAVELSLIQDCLRPSLSMECFSCHLCHTKQSNAIGGKSNITESLLRTKYSVMSHGVSDVNEPQPKREDFCVGGA